MKPFANEIQGEAQPQPNIKSARLQQAITEVALIIRDSPDTSGGVQLRRFLWSLYNMHHLVNLWDFASRVGAELADPIAEILSAALAGELREDDVKQGLLLAGEMDRWDTTLPCGESLKSIADAESSLGTAIRNIPPGREHTELVRTLASLERLRSEVNCPILLTERADPKLLPLRRP